MSLALWANIFSFGLGINITGLGRLFLGQPESPVHAMSLSVMAIAGTIFMIISLPRMIRSWEKFLEAWR